MVPSSKDKDGNSHPLSRFMVVWGLGTKGLQNGQTRCTSGCWFGQRFRDKGMSHIISMIHTQQWWFRNFMQNQSCMHPCGHSSIKFLWSCDTRAQDSFFLLKSTQCFQNILFCQFMHPSKSILGVRKTFHNFHPSYVYTFFFNKNLVFLSVNLSKEKWEFISFRKRVDFLVNQFHFYFVFVGGVVVVLFT